MKQIVVAATTALLLCSAPAAFAQTAAAPSAPAAVTPAQGQAAVDTLKNMPKDQQQKMIQSGVDNVQNLSPEQLKQFKEEFDSLPADQKAELEKQISDQMKSNPQLENEAEQKLKNMSPEQKKQLEGVGQ